MKRWLFVLVLILALVLGACAPKPAVVEEEAGEPAETSEDVLRTMQMAMKPM